MSLPTKSQAFTRLPVTGSCHCKTIRYIIYLRIVDPSKVPADAKVDGTTYYDISGGQRQYRCNCTICHKTGMLHLRLASPPDDFFLLAPTDISTKDSGLSVYKNNWYFCNTCGVRCFIVSGLTETTEAELPAELLNRFDISGDVEAVPNKDGVLVKRVPVWKPKEGWIQFPSPNANSSLSVNMCTLDADQEGFDLRSFHDNGWIGYCEMLKEKKEFHTTPFEGGMY